MCWSCPSQRKNGGAAPASCRPWSADELRRVVEQGAWELAKTFQVPALAGYLRQSAGEVLPRLQVALEHDSLEGIFVTC